MNDSVSDHCFGRTETATLTSTVIDRDGDVTGSSSLELKLLDGKFGVLAGIRDTVTSTFATKQRM